MTLKRTSRHVVLCAFLFAAAAIAPTRTASAGEATHLEIGGLNYNTLTEGVDYQMSLYGMDANNSPSEDYSGTVSFRLLQDDAPVPAWFEIRAASDGSAAHTVKFERQDHGFRRVSIRFTKAHSRPYTLAGTDNAVDNPPAFEGRKDYIYVGNERSPFLPSPSTTVTEAQKQKPSARSAGAASPSPSVTSALLPDASRTTVVSPETTRHNLVGTELKPSDEPSAAQAASATHRRSTKASIIGWLPLVLLVGAAFGVRSRHRSRRVSP